MDSLILVIQGGIVASSALLGGTLVLRGLAAWKPPRVWLGLSFLLGRAVGAGLLLVSASIGAAGANAWAPVVAVARLCTGLGELALLEFTRSSFRPGSRGAAVLSGLVAAALLLGMEISFVRGDFRGIGAEHWDVALENAARLAVAGFTSFETSRAWLRLRAVAPDAPGPLRAWRSALLAAFGLAQVVLTTTLALDTLQGTLPEASASGLALTGAVAGAATVLAAWLACAPPRAFRLRLEPARRAPAR